MIQRIFIKKYALYIKIILLLYFYLFSIAVFSKPLANIDSLRWSKRIVIFNMPDNLKQLKQQLKKESSQINDRDIVWFVLNRENNKTVEATNYPYELKENFIENTRAQTNLKAGEVILIGKDGGVKHRYTHFNFEKLYQHIDAMPMRRQEMLTQ